MVHCIQAKCQKHINSLSTEKIWKNANLLNYPIRYITLNVFLFHKFLFRLVALILLEFVCVLTLWIPCNGVPINRKIVEKTRLTFQIQRSPSVWIELICQWHFEIQHGGNQPIWWYKIIKLIVSKCVLHKIGNHCLFNFPIPPFQLPIQ